MFPKVQEVMLVQRLQICVMIMLSAVFPYGAQIKETLVNFRAQERKQAACKWDSDFRIQLLHNGLVKAQLSASAVFTLLGHLA